MNCRVEVRAYESPTTTTPGRSSFDDLDAALEYYRTACNVFVRVQLVDVAGGLSTVIKEYRK